MTHRITLPGVLAAACLAGPGLAAEGNPAMIDYVRGQAAQWMTMPELLAALADSNARHAALSETDILAMDEAWRSEIGLSQTPTISAVTGSEASARIRAALEASGGRITEIIVMDNRGLNVATSGVTSDFWQGDEAKFQQTFPLGVGAVHADEIEYDESTQTYQIQVSVPLAEAGGSPIGAVTVGLNIDAF